MAEFDMYDTELKQLVYLLYANLVHQTRERELVLERSLSTIQFIRSELRTISEQLRHHEKNVWRSYHDLKGEQKKMAAILDTVRKWFRDFGRRPRPKHQKRDRTKRSTLPADPQDKHNKGIKKSS